MDNTPTKAGMYFARERKGFQWYNLILCVSGDAPYLYISWVFSRNERIAMKPEKYWKPESWGPEIVDPEFKEDQDG